MIVICILSCAAAEAGIVSAIIVTVGRIETKFIKGSEGIMIYKPCGRSYTMGMIKLRVTLEGCDEFGAEM